MKYIVFSFEILIKLWILLSYIMASFIGLSSALADSRVWVIVVILMCFLLGFE